MAGVTHRLFLAVPIPEDVRRALLDWAARFRRHDDGWRWVAPAGIHLTLRFYGSTAESTIPALVESVTSLAATEGPFEARAAGWGVFPGPGRPRVLWAGLAAPGPALAALAAGAERQARVLGFAPEDRPFHPHLTLARAAERGGRPQLPGAPDRDAPEFGLVPVSELVVYESHLGPGGAVYEVVARAPLGAVNRRA